MTAHESIGPIDVTLLEFSEDTPTGEVAAELLAAADAGVIAIYDIIAIRKRADGSVERLELSDLDDGQAAMMVLAGAHSGLLGENDVGDAGSMLTPGSMAAVLDFENTWAAPLTFAVHLAVASSPQVCAFPHRPSPSNSTCSKQRRRPSKSSEEADMGLLRGTVKTAAVAGTSQAVRGRVSRRQAERYSDSDNQIAATRGAGCARGAQSTRAAPPPAATGGVRPIIEQLKQLAELRDQGILTNEKFQAQKARVLAQ
jgi:hypothetical protein